jgi:peptidoglycan/xylan/chitin deacetylase (PgdA/CDA1 family)
MNRVLHVVVYHYVRNLPNTPFPRIKGMLTTDFQQQVDFLRTRFEMATLESAIAFWQCQYVPTRDLCLLTFDDGLKDHFTDVWPILAERKIQGLFFIITSCIEEKRVVPVHQNHFLMAALDFKTYKHSFLQRLAVLSPMTIASVDREKAQRTYRWDDAETASLKYLVNFHLPDGIRDQILNELFHDHFGDESDFAKQLYLSWEQAREMQLGGMIIGGHSHQHMPLAALELDGQKRDLDMCSNILRRQLHEQALWPFSYPYGNADNFNKDTARAVRQVGFTCAFSTIRGETRSGDDVYTLSRVDTNDMQTGMDANRQDI